MKTTGIFERFQYFNFKTNFLKNLNPFQKKMEYFFLVESTKLENATFPCKTALSKANVKTNKMGSTKWTYHKIRSFVSNYFIFWTFYFSLRISYKELIWCTNHSNWFDVPTIQISIFILFESARVLFESLFFLWVSLTCFDILFWKKKSNFWHRYLRNIIV